ncbi:potassium transporter Kup [Desulfovibrio gilichinskyi]|uniref:Probable potassium transport system protein Kup n=1 Tax=Desulfovibrio gilichinskyi TaxID=1519643 RepID=A0A1X7CFA9_9BACT|nr:KUP/HAK/KT family potassium transporter [Desulfovibrio gilichinskyi]SME95630.1 KUP system potassium uptake protein [Desulfovibrio gilichinskyi]
MTENNKSSRNIALSLGALGVVFGDIGTSPLYALKACFSGYHAIPLTQANVLGVLSLIIWSLFVVISLKYVTFVMAADNKGEGGIFALYELVRQSKGTKSASVMLISSLIGGALLYGDGVITPAISVLSAIEGLDVATTAAHDYIIYISCTILLVLFAFQRSGTDKIGRLFGPIMMVWFAVIGVFGALSMLDNPIVLEAFSPLYGVSFFAENGIAGTLVLGAVVLCVTGGEALFADMGHFGRKPITLAWYFVALPSLLLNYLGQGALLINNPMLIIHPFFSLFPKAIIFPIVGLATMAAIIASQAIISGAFSLTSQAVHLGFIPRIRILQTSELNPGQVYVSSINWIMAALSIFLVVSFKHSEELAGAYGIAITGTMVITTYLFWFYLRNIKKWNIVPAVLLISFFACFDLGFLIVNFTKIRGGGWFPILLAAIVAYIMYVWLWGREEIYGHIMDKGLRISDLEPEIEKYLLAKIPGEAVFLTASNYIPVAFLQHLRRNRVVHEKLVFLQVETQNQPYVDSGKRISVKKLKNNVSWVTVSYGFMEKPNVPVAVFQAWNQIAVSRDECNYYVGKVSIKFNPERTDNKFKRKLFILLSSISNNPVDYFKIPEDLVVTIGTGVKL